MLLAEPNQWAGKLFSQISKPVFNNKLLAQRDKHLKIGLLPVRKQDMSTAVPVKNGPVSACKR